jgi:general secretion pathway protein G
MIVLNRSRRASRAGFSLIEIVVAISIIATLVGVVAFRSGNAIQRGQASRLVQLVKNIEKAALVHYSDTGAYAREYQLPQSGTNRQLSATQTATGWSGPYIERPFAQDDTNPFGTTHLYSLLNTNNWIQGFDTDGDGTIDLSGDGNMLYFSGVTEEVAQSIDNAFDSGLPGDWFTTGRVVYQAGSSRLLVYVFK